MPGGWLKMSKRHLFNPRFSQTGELSNDRVPRGLFFFRRLEAVDSTGVIPIEATDQSVPCCLFFSGPRFAFFCHADIFYFKSSEAVESSGRCCLLELFIDFFGGHGSFERVQ